MKLVKNKYIAAVLLATLSFFSAIPTASAVVATDEYVAANTAAVECGTSAYGEGVIISSRLLELILGKKDVSEGEILLVPGGAVFGAKIKQAHVTVEDPGAIKELKKGDKILSVNGTEVTCGREIESLIRASEGEPVSVVLQRAGRTVTVKLRAHKENGEYRLGITLKEGAAGIGTITYVDPGTGLFGGLGHGICDADSGTPIEISDGSVTGVILGGVKKGEAGKPGELSGILTDKTCGIIYANTECGVFGRLNELPTGLSLTPIKIGSKSEVHTGAATIYSTVKMGTCKEFNIEITEINTASTGAKSFKIKVTDPALIAITGGVVRGMSGSPIIQDGKLVGAVTHVMVNEPTEGYGIFIENMLNAAQSQVQPKAA